MKQLKQGQVYWLTLIVAASVLSGFYRPYRVPGQPAVTYRWVWDPPTQTKEPMDMNELRKMLEESGVREDVWKDAKHEPSGRVVGTWDRRRSNITFLIIVVVGIVGFVVIRLSNRIA